MREEDEYVAGIHVRGAAAVAVVDLSGGLAALELETGP